MMKACGHRLVGLSLLQKGWCKASATGGGRRASWIVLALGLVTLGGGGPGCGGSAGGGGAQDAAAPLDAVGRDASALDGGGELDGTISADAAPDAGPSRPVFGVCDQDPLPGGLPIVDWNHTLSAITAAATPGHSAQDVITVAGRATALVGKFAYGTFSKDLQDEWIEVFLDRCQGELVRLGRALTDSDGRISFALSGPDVPPVGAYRVYLRVMGDDTHAESTLRVVLPGTHVAVLDIDGTLTTDDMELFQDVFADLFEPLGAGNYVPQARAGAIDLTLRRRMEQGYLLVYITGRPYWLTDITRGWLSDEGAAPAHLHLSDSNGEAMPTESGVGTYKADYLAFLQSLGLILDLAYGNATTDIYAYEQAGVDKAHTFILGSHGGEGGTVALGDDYLQHLTDIASEPDVSQPFDWQ